MNVSNLEYLHHQVSHGDEKAMLDLAQHYSQQVPSKDPGPSMHAAMELAYLLNNWRYSEPLWRIIHELAERASPEVRETLTIAVFETLPEKPVDEHVMQILWSFRGMPRSRWIIDAAYRRCPEARKKEDERKYTTTQVSDKLWSNGRVDV